MPEIDELYFFYEYRSGWSEVVPAYLPTLPPAGRHKNQVF